MKLTYDEAELFSKTVYTVLSNITRDNCNGMWTGQQAAEAAVAVIEARRAFEAKDVAPRPSLHDMGDGHDEIGRPVM